MKLTGKTFVLILIAVILLAATVFLGIFGLQGFSFFTRKGIELIDFTGMKKEAAEQWRLDHRLDESKMVFSYAYDELAEEDTVIAQSPESGAVLEKDGVISLTLSNGKDPNREIELPDFTALTRSEIEAWAKENGFTNLYFAFAADDSLAKDTFLESDPKAGEPVRRNQKIVITVCAGSREETDAAAEITVPDFSSYTAANAEAWGSTNRVSVSVQRQSSETTERDRLISQNPKAGARVKSGSSVFLIYSSGKGISVKSYVGRTKAEAEAWIQSSGLKSVYTEVFHGTVKAGNIISQTPSSGMISPGDAVVFEISAGPVPIDDYKGRSKAEFEAYISDLNTRKNGSAHIAVSVQEEESSEEAGTILRQSVIGDTAPDTTVTITAAVRKKVQIVSKAGMEEADFRTYLSNMNMKPGNISSAFHDSIGEGKIIRNDTGVFAEGSSIGYTVSKGVFRWDYEDLIKPGSSWSSLYSASAAARANGWTLTKSDAESDTYNRGEIIECNVKDKAVACRVSTGKVVIVPDVVGKTKREAVELLEAAGLAPLVRESSDYREEAKDTVIGQSLAPQSKVAGGTAVSITCSKGPKPAETAALPRFSIALWDGQPEEKIRADLTRIYQARGFRNLKFTVKDTSFGNNMNGIESISPSPDGSSVNKDTEITIVILAGKSS